MKTFRNISNKSILFIAPGSLEVPTSRGGGIEQNIFFLTKYLKIPSLIFSPKLAGTASLRQTGKSVTIYSNFPPVKNYPPTSKSFFSMYLNSIYLSFFYIESSLKVLQLNKQVDTVVIFNKFFAILPLMTARILRKKTIYMEYNIWPWCYSKNNKAIIRALAFWIHISFWKIVRRLSTAVTANSPSIKKDIISWGRQKQKFLLLPTGIEILPREDANESQNRDSYILYAGRLVEERGAHQIEDIIQKVLVNDNSAKFKIVGGGPLHQRIAEFVKEKKLHENVELLGQKDREITLSLMKKCIAILFISKNENYGSLAFLESMALGCPIIATNVGSTQQLIIDGVNGLLVKPNPDSIAQGIVYLLKNIDVRDKLSIGAKETSRQFYWETVAQSFINFYAEI